VVPVARGRQAAARGSRRSFHFSANPFEQARPDRGLRGARPPQELAAPVKGGPRAAAGGTNEDGSKLA